MSQLGTIQCVQIQLVITTLQLVIIHYFIILTVVTTSQLVGLVT